MIKLSHNREKWHCSFSFKKFWNTSVTQTHFPYHRNYSNYSVFSKNHPFFKKQEKEFPFSALWIFSLAPGLIVKKSLKYLSIQELGCNKIAFSLAYLSLKCSFTISSESFLKWIYCTNKAYKEIIVRIRVIEGFWKKKRAFLILELLTIEDH